MFCLPVKNIYKKRKQVILGSRVSFIHLCVCSCVCVCVCVLVQDAKCMWVVSEKLRVWGSSAGFEEGSPQTPESRGMWPAGPFFGGECLPLILDFPLA